ncbi:hypothetical protein F4604DRAFT_1950215 [Suillus subluteus]|nr:hypothetical protein F4604DRAFT_1950215 [Suillus subluteus]
MVVFFQCSDVHEDAIVFGEPLKFSETSRDIQPFPRADSVHSFSTLDSTELPEPTRFCVAPLESTGNFKAADSPIQLDQEIVSTHGPSCSKTPPLSMQINSVNMEQASTALQKVSNDCTTSAHANKDDAKNYGKVKEKRGAPGTTSSEPGQGRPLKRARSDCATAQNHETFYILDANTLIEVDGVLFKLHRSRLVTKSSFFAQLLEHNLKDDFPNNDDVWVENNGKVTVYHLGNITTADELVTLLKFDDNPIEYYFQPPPLSVLAPILRAATALRFEMYRVWAAQVLGQTWSSSLADLTPEPKENAAEFIALARSCDVNSGVKRALYELARTRRIGLHGNDVLGQSGLEQISHADQKCVVLIRELSVTTWSEIAVRIATSPCQGDKVNTSSPWNKKAKSSVPQETCSFEYGTQDAWERRIHDSGLYTKFLFDPVCGAQALIDIPWGEEGWCSHCIRSKRATWKKIREKLWSDMDKWIPGHE